MTRPETGSESRSVFNYPDDRRPYTRFANLIALGDLDLFALLGPDAPLTLTYTATGEWMWAYSDPAIAPTLAPQPFSGVVTQTALEAFAFPLTVVIEATDEDNTSGTLIFHDVIVEPSTADPALAIRKDGTYNAALKLVATSSFSPTIPSNNSFFRSKSEALTISGVDCDARPDRVDWSGKFLPRLVFFAAEQAVRLFEGATLMGVSSFAIPDISKTSVTLSERREGTSIASGNDYFRVYNSYAMNHIEPLTVGTTDATLLYNQQFRPEDGATGYLREFPATDGYRSYVDPTPYGLQAKESDMHITLSDTENEYVEYVNCAGNSGLTLTLLGDRKLSLRKPYGVRLEVGEKDGQSAPSTVTVTLENYIQHDPLSSILLRKGSGLTLLADESMGDKIDNVVNVLMEKDASLSTGLPVNTFKFMASMGTVGEAWRALGVPCRTASLPIQVSAPGAEFFTPDDALLSKNLSSPEGLTVRTGFTQKTDQRWSDANMEAGTFFLSPNAGYIMAAGQG